MFGRDMSPGTGGDWIRYDGDNIGIEVIASPGYKFQSWEQLPENAEEAKWENEDGKEITGWLERWRTER